MRGGDGILEWDERVGWDGMEWNGWREGRKEDAGGEKRCVREGFAFCVVALGWHTLLALAAWHLAHATGLVQIFLGMDLK